MHEGLDQLLNHLPPKTAGALVQAINRCGAQLGIGPDWVRRWIGFTVVADALAQYQPNTFELKGGAAIELRLRRFEGAPVRPRATRDLDAAFRGELDEIEGSVRAALAEPRHDFAFRVETDDRPVEKMRSLTVRVSYRVERFDYVRRIAAADRPGTEVPGRSFCGNSSVTSRFPRCRKASRDGRIELRSGLRPDPRSLRDCHRGDFGTITVVAQVEPARRHRFAQPPPVRTGKPA